MQNNKMVTGFIAVLFYLLFAVSGTVMMKKGALSEIKEIPFPFMEINVSLLFIMGVISYGVSFCIYTFIITKMKISCIISILSGLNSISVAIAGVVIFDEILKKNQIVGIIFVIIGVALVGMGK